MNSKKRQNTYSFLSTWKKLKKHPSLWQKFFIREKIIKSIRSFFYQKKFHEVETPLLSPYLIPESYLEVFETTLLNRIKQPQKMYLTTSPEASLKKLLVAGIGNCFEISKSFRNTETDSNLHNPEFTILEWYRLDATYQDMMRDCEELILYIQNSIKNNTIQAKSATSIVSNFSTPSRQARNRSKNKQLFTYQGKVIDLSPPWQKISIVEALKKYARINFDDITNKYAKREIEMFPLQKIASIAKQKGYKVAQNNSWEEVFNQIFLNEIEPKFNKLSKPLIIYDFPRPIAALAKLKTNDPRLAERFELYIGGLEIADCYSELTDYQEQKQRFSREQKIRKRLGKISVNQDADFLQALKSGLPDCSGVALGIDRLVMFFTNSPSIQDVLLFPL